MGSLKRFGITACGWLLAYLAIGGWIGSLSEFLGPQTGCFPRTTVFGILESGCENQALKLLWIVLAELPRLFSIFPVLFFTLAIAGLKNGIAFGYLTESAVWLLYSVPLLLLVWLGFEYWRRKSRISAWIFLGLFCANVLLLVARM